MNHATEEQRIRAYEAEGMSRSDAQAVVEAEDMRAATWRAMWPNHCKACAGWGGATFFQSHPYGMGSAQEQMFDPCEAPSSAAICHRCGEAGLTEDGEGPCKACGWNYDDGEPQQ